MESKADFMELAFVEAQAAGTRGEVPIGAVLVHGPSGSVLAQAGNRVEEWQDATAHAEMVVLRAAAGRADHRLAECDLYVSLEPCAMCAAAIALARIRRLYFGAYDPKGGGIEHGPRIFAQPTTHHRPEVIGGLHEARAAELLKRFFRELRPSPRGLSGGATDAPHKAGHDE
jgi:tRNA(Arg) A34 adenosine deaminase TadA